MPIPGSVLVLTPSGISSLGHSHSIKSAVVSSKAIEVKELLICFQNLLLLRSFCDSSGSETFYVIKTSEVNTLFTLGL